MPLKKVKKVIQDTSVKQHFTRFAVFFITMLFVVLVYSIIRRSFFGGIEPEKHIYFEITLLLLLAVLAETAVFYFKMHNVIVLMLLGMLISPGFIEITWNFLLSQGADIPTKVPVLFLHTDIINIFAQLGAIILLFKVGLHSKIEKIFSKENLLVAIAGIVLPFFGGYLYANFNRGDFAYSMFVGAALSATSVGVTVAILKEMKVLNKKFSDVIIGAAILDDILGLLLLSVVVNLSQASGGAVSSVIRTFAIAVVFMIGIITLGKYFIEYFDKGEMDQKKFLMSMAFMLMLSYLAEVISLSAIVGAFMAGIILNRSRHYKELEEKTYGLEFLFMPIFFISLGILIDVKSIAAFFVPICIITVIAVLTKIIGCGGTALLSGLNLKESIIVGIGMVPRGEVALIIASIGLSQGVLSTNEYSIISAMALLTSFLVPSILTYLIKIHQPTIS